MPTFRILYLRQSKLEGAEILSGLDLLEAIDKASDRVGPETAEIWSNQGKVDVVAPRPRRPRPSAAADSSSEEAQIARVMTALLRLAP